MLSKYQAQPKIIENKQMALSINFILLLTANIVFRKHIKCYTKNSQTGADYETPKLSPAWVKSNTYQLLAVLLHTQFSD